MADVFTRSRASQYWYWAGVNWVSIGVALTATAVYILMYDPSTYRAVPMFRYLGAGIPLMLLAGGTYFFLARFVLRPMGKGGYHTTPADCTSPAALRDVTL
jgi:NCS1 family nucleobase:cation symporter-1